MDVLLYSLIGVGLILSFYFLFPTRKVFRQNQTIKKQALEIKYQNKILEEQNERLKVLDIEKSQLISVVSHDLKSPLNRVFALTNLVTIEGDNLTEDQREYIDRIHIVVAEGQNLIRNLLDIRAIEDKGITLKFEDLNLQKVLSELARGFKHVANRKGITLRFTESKIRLRSDKLYLQRILENVISNAIKYTELNGEVEVNFTDGEEYILCTVSDEGPGISAGEQKKLYQKYEILSSKPTGGETSTGLGLSIVKSLIEKLGGEISHENREEKGSFFFIKIPKKTSLVVEE